MRVAFFNVENLFARAAVFNVGADHYDSAVLDRLSSLRKELARESYAGREEIIVRLYERLDHVVSVNEERDNLMRRNRQGRVVGLVAKGRADWDGSLRLKDARLRQHNRANTARVIETIAADAARAASAVASVQSRRSV
jgi:hypothetical protein